MLRPELSARALIVGVALGLVFTIANVYLVLTSGISISASIPSAAIGALLLGGWTRLRRSQPANILEHNIVQTTASVGESIAFAVVVTVPLFSLFRPELSRTTIFVTTLTAAAAGIMLYAPLQAAFEGLKFPEGLTCARLLQAVERSQERVSRPLVEGAGFGGVYWIARTALTRFITSCKFQFPPSLCFVPQLAPEYMGIGFLIGYDSALTIALGALVKDLALRLDPAGNSAQQNFFVVGLLTVGASVRIGRTLNIPALMRAFRQPTTSGATGAFFLVLASVTTAYTMGLPTLIIAALSLVALGCAALFIRISAAAAGQYGSSTNPVSAMALGSVVIAGMLFLSAQHDSRRDVMLVISIVVAVSASAAGMTAQVLKTGTLVSGSPNRQLIAVAIGAVTSVAVIAVLLQPILHERLDQSKSHERVAAAPDCSGCSPGVSAERAVVRDCNSCPIGATAADRLPPPTRVIYNVMKSILAPARSHFDMALLGGLLAVLLAAVGVSPFAVGIGMYIGTAVAVPIALGGIAERYFTRGSDSAASEPERNATRTSGELWASGLVAVGVIMSAALGLFWRSDAGNDNLFGLLLFLVLVWMAWRRPLLRRNWSALLTPPQGSP
jgi:uncharacterized oligopeptide transporter (OPT) family protein